MNVLPMVLFLQPHVCTISSGLNSDEHALLMSVKVRMVHL